MLSRDPDLQILGQSVIQVRSFSLLFVNLSVWEGISELSYKYLLHFCKMGSLCLIKVPSTDKQYTLSFNYEIGWWAYDMSRTLYMQLEQQSYK